MTGNRTRLAAVALAALALAGCGLFGSRPDYTDSREGRPLEVPPDLDTPSTANALTIPTTPAAASAAPAAAPLAGYETGGAPPAVAAGEDGTINVPDSVAATWRRVGLALERSGVAELTARDEVAATYTVSGTTTVTRPGGGNFITRMFRDDTIESVPATRVVRIVADGAGSVVRVENEQGTAVDDELARRLVAAIKQRLG